jgi:hypothetical protein
MSSVVPISGLFFFMTYDHYCLNNSGVQCGTHIRVALFNYVRQQWSDENPHHVCISRRVSCLYHVIFAVSSVVDISGLTFLLLPEQNCNFNVLRADGKTTKSPSATNLTCASLKKNLESTGSGTTMVAIWMQSTSRSATAALLKI